MVSHNKTRAEGPRERALDVGALVRARARTHATARPRVHPAPRLLRPRPRPLPCPRPWPVPVPVPQQPAHRFVQAVAEVALCVSLLPARSASAALARAAAAAPRGRRVGRPASTVAATPPCALTVREARACMSAPDSARERAAQARRCCRIKIPRRTTPMSSQVTSPSGRRTSSSPRGTHKVRRAHIACSLTR